VIAAHTQLRLARPLVEDLRWPWEKPAPPGRLTPARVRRSFAEHAAHRVGPTGLDRVDLLVLVHLALDRHLEFHEVRDNVVADAGVDMDVNLRRLRYFLAVADHHHFGRAAEALYLSPTALSEQIRKLETELGVRVFARNPRGAQLTDVGADVANQARLVLAQADRLAEVVSHHRRQRAKSLRLGFVTMGAGTFTPQLLNLLERDNPGCTVELVYLDFAQQVQAVVAGEVDAAIVRGPLYDAQVRSVVLTEEPRMVMLSQRHPLACRAQVRCADLHEEVRVTRHGVPDRWRKWWSLDPGLDGSSPPYGPVVHTFDEQLEIAAGGIAVSIVPAATAVIYHRDDIAFVPISDAEPSQTLLCARVDDDSPSVAVLFAACAELLGGPRNRM
jgi:DNA-binding transcriptional LysR family regulator